MAHDQSHAYGSRSSSPSHNTQNAATDGHAWQNNNHGPNQQVNFGPGPQTNDHRSGTHYYGNVGSANHEEGRKNRDKIMRNLHVSPYKSAKDRNPVRVPGTCEWFVQHRNFQHWRNSPASNMLWVSADPGSGKSVLARYLIDIVLPDSSSTVCYFFFKDDFDDQKLAKNAISSILHTLFTERPELLSDSIVGRFQRGAGFKPGSTEDLWAIFKEALSTTQGSTDTDQHPNPQQTHPAHNIFCVIDAFDECRIDGQAAFSNLLCDFYLHIHAFARESNFKVKFVVTSRPYTRIRRHFHRLLGGSLPLIHLDGDGDDEKDQIQDEIGIYIDAKVKYFESYFSLSARKTKLLSTTLKSVPNRTYLWVYLMLDWFKDELDKDDEKDIIEITSRLPPNVDSAYELILAKSRKPEKAKKLLHIIVSAIRPLSLEEMHIALAVERHHKAYDRSNTDPDSSTTIGAFDERWFREYVRNLCGLFVIIVDAKVYLLHQTARTFLVGDGISTSSTSAAITKASDYNNSNTAEAPKAWKHSLQLQRSHQILLQICAWYLDFDAFKARPIPADFGECESRAIVSEYKANHPFLSYCANYWTRHIFDGNLEDDIDLLRAIIQAPGTFQHCGPPWFDVYYLPTFKTLPRGFTSLMIASYCGLAKTVQILLQQPKVDVNAKCRNFGHSALALASKYGFDNVVEVLLASKAVQDQKAPTVSSSKMIEVDIRDHWNLTPLCHASAAGQTRIVHMLFVAGADISAESINGDTALLLAAKNKYHDTVEFLLRAGAKVDAVNAHGETALSLAFINRQYNTAELLFRAGAKVDAVNNHDHMPLLFAVWEGQTECVKLLLDAGADANMSYWHTPALTIALRQGFADIVQLLFDAGAVE